MDQMHIEGSVPRNAPSWFASLFNRQSRRQGSERRQTPRKQLVFQADISVPLGYFPVSGVDFSAGGARVIAPEPLPVGSVVFIHLKTFRLMGFAHVRHCARRYDLRYSIGLEFPTALMEAQRGAWHIERVSIDTIPKMEPRVDPTGRTDWSFR